MTFLTQILAALLMVLTMASASYAGLWHDVKLADNIEVSDTGLILNGMALRKVKRFGFYIKVYVGGLYLREKSTDASAIMESKGPKKLIMQFKRSVDRGKITDGFDKGFDLNCEALCTMHRKHMEQFNSYIGNIKKNQQIHLTFSGDSVEVETQGSDPRKGVVKGGHDFNKIILGMYIGKKPPSQRFKNEMLGLAKKTKE